MTDIAHEEDGHITPVQQFDWEAVERNLFSPESVKELEELTQEDIDRALKMFDVVLRWVFQNGMKNSDGLKIRAIIVCWIFLKELRPYKLVDMATGFGMQKQSLGRWHDDFKIRFPGIKTPHMR